MTGRVSKQLFIAFRDVATGYIRWIVVALFGGLLMDLVSGLSLEVSFQYRR